MLPKIFYRFPEIDPENRCVVNFLNNLGQEMKKLKDAEVGIDRSEDDVYRQDIQDFDQIDPFESAHNECIKMNISNAMNILNEREKKIISLRFGVNGEGETDVETIASIFGCSVSNVNNLLRRILIKLRHPASIKMLN
jgi:RNA polymerase sporulation-specific sigma factor